jgi:tetratricopeptide (TPR) repeat protein
MLHIYRENNIYGCGTGIHANGVSISLPTGNNIHDNDLGVLFSGYIGGLFFPNNKIINNDVNIYIETNAHPDFGVMSDQGRNSIYGGYPYEIKSYYSGTISAQYNWWGMYPIYPSNYPMNIGTINTNNALNYNPNPRLSDIEEEGYRSAGTSLKKISNMPEIPKDIQEFDEARMLMHDKTKEKEGEILLLNILNNYHDKQSGRLALVTLYDYYNRIEDENSKKRILSESTEKDESLSSLAMYLKARDYKESDDCQNTAEELEKVVAKKHNSDIMPYVYYDLATLYYYYLDNTEKGIKYYTELAEKYPEEAITKTVVSIFKLKKDEDPTKEEAIVTETKLFANYPNPFNPSTVIKYQLADASQVSLKVYDVMGREVATLVNGFQNAGSYNVTFNANGLSSGIYFYKLNANGKQLINKMLLMKYSLVAMRFWIKSKMTCCVSFF